MIKLAYKMNKYRKQLNNLIQENDTIIELGCHVGKTSQYILNNQKQTQLICLDNSPEAIKPMTKLENNNPNLKFIKHDVRLHESLLEVKKLTNKCDILSIDLGGGYHPDTTFKVYYIWSSTFKPRDTIIRNRGLIDFTNTSENQEKNIKSEKGYLESCRNMGIPPQIKEFKLWSKK